MRYCRALIILLLAAIVAVSGCMEFGELPDTPPTAQPQAAVSPSAYSVPGSQVPSSQVTVTLTDIDYNRSSDLKQDEYITLTFKNTGTTDVSNVGFTVKAKDTPTGEILYSGAVPVGSIPAGGEQKGYTSIPAHKYVNTMTLSVTVYWGYNPAYVNDDARPWVISLATNPYW